MNRIKDNYYKLGLVLRVTLLAGLLSSCGGGGDNNTPPATYTVSGTVTGLAGTGLVLQNNSGDDLSINSDGSFTFSTALEDNTAYSVTVQSQPDTPRQTCTVTNSSGTLAGANVSNIAISCVNNYTIGGSVTGLTGSGLVLQNNGGDDQLISADGSFTFTTAIADGSNYAVTVATQPSTPSQTCTVSNANGTLAGADITNIAISCVNNYTIGGTVSGLVGSGLVLNNNGGDALSISADGSFTFTTPIADGSTYAVTVATQPSTPDQICNVTNGSGTLTGANISNVSVNCPPAAVTPIVSSTKPRVLTFSWNDVGADHYKLLKNPDGVSGYTQVGVDLVAYSVEEEIPVHLFDWVNASYIVQSCDASAVCTDSTAISATSTMLDAIGYFKASNTNTQDFFGSSVTLSVDGNTLAVGAYSTSNGGNVYVFVRSGNTWSQQAYLQASNAEAFDAFGYSVSLSSDGNTLAVGAFGEKSAATGIDGDQADNTITDAGAVYLFVRSGSTWTQQAYIKASNTGPEDRFGHDVALSTDGNTLAVSAVNERSGATGINGNQADDTAWYAGAVYTFVRSGSTWSQQAYIKASNASAGDGFGESIALAADGNTLAVGADFEDSAATGINGNEADNTAGEAGSVYVFVRSGSIWSQQAYIKASNTGADDRFGTKVALSADGNTLAASAINEDAAATGIDGNQADDTAGNAGAVYAFVRSGTSWSQQAYIKASNTDPADYFGTSIALTTDGNSMLVGANGETSAAAGVNGDQTDNSTFRAGAAYLFTRSGSTWSQQAYLKPSNTENSLYFGSAVTMTGDGSILAVGADSDDSAATGINGDRLDQGEANSGAVHLY